MDFDFSQLLSGPYLYIAAGIIILLLARNNKDGNLSNILITILQQLLNTPKPIDIKNQKSHRAEALVGLSEHCRKCGNDMIADQLLGSLPAVIKEPGKDDK